MNGDHLTGLRIALWCGLLGAVVGGSANPALSKDPSPKAASGGKAFVDITDRAGVRFRHHKCVLDPKLECIMTWMASVGASVAAADYDRDGDIDLYAVSSMLDKPNKLFRNNGDMTFTDVAAKVGLDGANYQPVLFTMGTE